MSRWLASATAQIYFVLKIENLYESGVADASHLLMPIFGVQIRVSSPAHAQNQAQIMAAKVLSRLLKSNSGLLMSHVCLC
jgi:hypothetical protein